MESLGARTAIAPAVVRVQAKNVKPLRGSAASRVRAVLNKDQDKSADDRAKSAVAGASRTGAESGKIGARAASARARRGRSARFEHPGRSDRVSRVAACALETPAAPPPSSNPLVSSFLFVPDRPSRKVTTDDKGSAILTAPPPPRPFPRLSQASSPPPSS